LGLGFGFFLDHTLTIVIPSNARNLLFAGGVDAAKESRFLLFAPLSVGMTMGRGVLVERIT
jgi:hypothetical protein